MKNITISVYYTFAWEVAKYDLSDHPELKTDEEKAKFIEDNPFDWDLGDSIGMYTEDGVIGQINIKEPDKEEYEVDVDDVCWDSEDEPIGFGEGEYAHYVQKRAWMDYNIELDDDEEFDIARLAIYGIDEGITYYRGEIIDDEYNTMDICRDIDEDDVIRDCGYFADGADEYLAMVVINGKEFKVNPFE